MYKLTKLPINNIINFKKKKKVILNETTKKVPQLD